MFIVMTKWRWNA